MLGPLPATALPPRPPAAITRPLAASSPAPSVQGCFSVRHDPGRWHLISPDGTPFFITGLNVVRPWDDSGGPPGPRYDGLADNQGDLEAWSRQTLRRMDEWNFNTIGPWSTLRGKPYTVEVSLSGWVMNVFDSNFEQTVKQHADLAAQRDDVGDYAVLDKDPNCIGYFTDNELNWGWGYSWRTPRKDSLFEQYAALPARADGKKAWANFMAQAYRGDFAKLSAEWNVDVKNLDDLCAIPKIAPRSEQNFDHADQLSDAFLRQVADRYYRVVDHEMRQRLPHHLNLGSRLTTRFPRPVAEVAGKYNDVVSVNIYESDLNFFEHELKDAHDLSGKPILVTEFAFVAEQNRSGNDNHWYKTCTVPSDRERGQSLVALASRLSQLDYLVGYTWFQFFDEPTHGRGDTECSNFGLVDVHNQIYQDLASSAARANAEAIEAGTR